MIKRAIIPQVLELNSFTDNLSYFSYGESLVDNIFPSAKGKVSAEISIKNNDYFAQIWERGYRLRFSDNIRMQKNGEEVEIIHYKKLYPLGKLYMHIVIKRNSVRVAINNFYYRTIKFQIENTLPPGAHLKNLIYLALADSGYLSVHAAAFAINRNEGVLAIASHNVGKSRTVSEAVIDGGYYLSEDIAVVDGKSIFSTPYTSTLYHEFSKRKYLSLFAYFVKSHRPVGLALRAKTLQKVPLKYICILEKSGKEEIFEVSTAEKKEIIDKVLLLNRDEFRYSTDEVILPLLYYSQKQKKTEEFERSMMAKMIDRCRVFVVRSEKQENFYRLIKGRIKGQGT